MLFKKFYYLRYAIVWFKKFSFCLEKSGLINNIAHSFCINRI